MNSLRIYINKRHYAIALGIVTASLVLKYFYIFNCTSFGSSLVMDMGSYWQDSFQRAWGNQSSMSQWGNFPPFYNYFFLAPFFKIFNSIGCFSYALPLVILINIFLYAISAYVFYLLLGRLIANKAIALTALVFYAFSYLAAYVNALVLPDSLAVALAVIATGIVVLTINGWAFLMAGLLLGAAIAAKPLLISFSPVFMWYIFSKNNKKRRPWMTVVFTAALIILPLMTVTESCRVSHGEVKSLGALGGLNFYQGWAKIKRVCRTDACFGSPGAIDEPAWREVTVTKAWYDQRYFYHLGIKAIAANPGVFLEKVLWFKKLFWGLLGPNLTKAPEGYARIMPVFQCFSYGMFVFWGMLFLLGRRTGAEAHTCHFLISLLISFFIIIYAIGLPERRYFLNIEFLVTALFFIMLDRAGALWRVYKREIWIYILFVSTFFICIPWVWSQWSK